MNFLSFFLKKSETSESTDGRWDSLRFNPVKTDYMYVMKSSGDGSFSDGRLRHYGNIEMIPSAAVLNYGQVCYLKLKWFTWFLFH